MKRESEDIKSEQEEEIFLNSKNIMPTTFTEIIESREQNNLPFFGDMPNIKDFYISFIDPYNLLQSSADLNYNVNNNEITEPQKKIKIRKKDLYKIFKMTKFPKDEINPYITFSFTSIKSEIVRNTSKVYKLDYNKLRRLIQFYYVQPRNKDSNIEIDQKSLMKIFDLLNLNPNERLNRIQFYEVGEEVEYEEEEEEEESEVANSKPLSQRRHKVKKTSYQYSVNINGKEKKINKNVEEIEESDNNDVNKENINVNIYNNPENEKKILKNKKKNSRKK